LTQNLAQGEYLLTGSQDKLINLYNPHTGALIKSYSGHGREVCSIAVLVFFFLSFSFIFFHFCI